MERILKTLPVPVISYIAMDISYHLSTFSHMNKFYLGSESMARIGMAGESMSMAPEQVECLQRLTAGMREFMKEVDDRNKGAYFKYDVMSPENVPITTQL